MCRFLAYKGRPILIDELLYQPKNSLIRQSACAHEAEEPLNGDGFGVGWYTPDISPEPGLYVSVRPAWNDRNLRYLCRQIKTETLFAHVRAASEGEVSEANCHPFHYKNFLFMHNGGIGGFAKIKRLVRRQLSDEIYDWVRGQTDSEHLFGMILENIKALGHEPNVQELTTALETTIRQIQEIKKKAGVDEACYINCTLTDGKVMIAARYVSDPNEKASTLYYSEGHHYECIDGVCMMKQGRGDQSVLVVSEKLTREMTEWREIPTNRFCIIDENLKVRIKPIEDGFLDHNAVVSEQKPKEAGRGFQPRRNV